MARRKKREAVVFLNEHMKLVSEVLSEWERGRLFEQLRAYAMEGSEPDLTGESRLYRSIYSMMRSAQDKAIEQYEETCAKNKQKALKRVQQEAAANAAAAAAATAATAAGGSHGSHGSQSNIIESNQIKNNLIKSNLTQSQSDTASSLIGQEVKGVPGVVWA